MGGFLSPSRMPLPLAVGDCLTQALVVDGSEPDGADDCVLRQLADEVGCREPARSRELPSLVGCLNTASINI